MESASCIGKKRNMILRLCNPLEISSRHAWWLLDHTAKNTRPPERLSTLCSVETRLSALHNILDIAVGRTEWFIQDYFSADNRVSKEGQYAIQ